MRISPWARAWLARIHFVSGEWAQALALASSRAAGSTEYEVVRVPTTLACAAVVESDADHADVLTALAPFAAETSAPTCQAPS